MKPASRGIQVPGKAIKDIAVVLIISLSITIVAYPVDLARGSDASSGDIATVGSVNGSRMMATITDLQDYGARAYFLNSTMNASAYIHDRFVELGLGVRYQEFMVDGFPQRNVIAVMNGTDPDAPQYLFGAHYDSITPAMLGLEEGDTTSAPGADDDASGVAAVIELATVLHDSRFNATVKFVTFAAEETGLNGSTEFVQDEMQDGVVYSDTVIMDMIGYRESQQNKAYIFRDTIENVMAEAVGEALNTYDLNLSLTFVSGTSMSASDHYPFWVAGYPSMLVIEEVQDNWPANPYYHTENDTVSHISEEQMTVVTKALVGGFLELQSPQTATETDSTVLIVTVIVLAMVAILAIAYVANRRKVTE